jgi:type II secretory pathway component PulK
MNPLVSPRRRGVALLVVLWLMAALTLLLYSFLAQMQVEYSLSGGYGDEKKAEQLAWSAIDYACVSADNNTQPWHGPSDTAWYHNPDRFYEVELGDGAFSLMHPTYDDDGKLRWGLEDEASKLSLNVATKEMLMKLPRMTEEIADSIIDWRDADSNPGPSGAENSFYQALNPAYNCKNAPFETIEELLYVRGVTPQVLYGLDQNLNGRIDPAEQSTSATTDPGLFGLVTCWSVDRNQTLNGQKRINVNAATPQQLQQAGFTPAEMQAMQAHLLARGPFTSVALLLGNPEAGVPPVLTKERFKLLADKFTMVDADTIPGLVNVNTAPKQVLLCLPGITEDLAVKIIDARNVPGADLSSMGWLTDVVTPAQLQQFANFITFHSYQYRIHAIGRVGTPYRRLANPDGDPQERPGAMKRMLAVYDRLAKPAPRLVYWRDATKLGMPYDPSQDSDQTVQQ